MQQRAGAFSHVGAGIRPQRDDLRGDPEAQQSEAVVWTRGKEAPLAPGLRGCEKLEQVGGVYQPLALSDDQAD